jgi:beta-glucanase (GH16 family)
MVVLLLAACQPAAPEPTEAPVEVPTEEPTEEPTAVPTEEPVEALREASTNPLIADLPELPENSVYFYIKDDASGTMGDPVVRDVRRWIGVGDVSTAVVDGMVEATVLEMGGNSWEPKFFVEMPQMVSGTEYTVSFVAYADIDRTVVMKVGQQLSNDPWWMPQFEGDDGVINLTTQPTEFSFSFVFEAGDLPVPYDLLWEVGDHMGEGALTTVYVANIMLAGQDCCMADAAQSEQADPYDSYDPEWELVWSDEFDGDSIDSMNWTYDIGTGSNGWGNRELQYYTERAENARIEDGSLVIEARQEAFEGSAYTSARLKTEGLQSFRYGRIEASIRLPEGVGIWPAFWMLGDNFSEVGWPYSGEIDIVELVGGPEEPDSGRGDRVVHGTVHWFDEDQSLKQSSGHAFASSDGAFSEGFHEFAIEWEPEYIHWFVDGERYHSVAISEDSMVEFQRSFFLLLNIAVGGNWPGSPDESTTFPQRMTIDYIRYYQDANLTPEPETVLSEDEKPQGDLFSVAIAEGFDLFASGSIVRYGGSNIPQLSPVDQAVDGEQALLAVFPGGDWGGLYIELAEIIDASAYANGDLVFSVLLPESISDFELKMESASGSTSVYIINYTPELIDESGFAQYRIPLADFPDVDLTQLRIPFAVWNPMGGGGSGEIIIDHVRFELGN